QNVGAGSAKRSPCGIMPAHSPLKRRAGSAREPPLMHRRSCVARGLRGDHKGRPYNACPTGIAKLRAFAEMVDDVGRVLRALEVKVEANILVWRVRLRAGVADHRIANGHVQI